MGVRLAVETKMNFFDKEQAGDIKEHYQNLIDSYDDIFLELSESEFLSNDANEYFRHGFLRRIKILKRCLQNIFTISAPDNLSKLSFDERSDLEINLQCFIFHVYGCIDNLIWVWVKEKNFQFVDRKKISFKNKDIKKQFSSKFKLYLDSRKSWFEHIDNFRHSLAHRVPLYVPPCAMNSVEYKRDKQINLEILEAVKSYNFDLVERLQKEQDSLGNFRPVYVHSYSEKSPTAVYHAQVIADFKTVIEFFRNFRNEIYN
jgi:hypothetical protein